MGASHTTDGSTSLLRKGLLHDYIVAAAGQAAGKLSRKAAAVHTKPALGQLKGLKSLRNLPGIWSAMGQRVR